MNRSSSVGLIVGLGLSLAAAGCVRGTDDSSDSEVATSVVSGALNNSSGTMVGWNDVPRAHHSPIQRLIDTLSPIGHAFAAAWSCSGDSLSPAYAGPGSYEFTPVSCSVTWRAGEQASSKWSGPFNLDYGASCDATHARIDDQEAGCTLTRTTAVGGDTRTITGPDGNAYAIDHDTNGAGSGWDSSVSPAPTNAGVILTCGAGGCDAGGNLVVSGSHITGTVAINKVIEKIYDHTISTSASGLTVSGTPGHRVVSGSVTVQHNLLQYTATASFENVSYADPLCCFPTSGQVTTSFHGGANVGKTETLSFGAVCGEATLTGPNGGSVSITMEHCL